LTSIPKSTFDGTKLSSVIIPELVTSIGNLAFRNVSTLTQITLPSGLLWLGGSMTFYGTAIKSLTLPANTQIIGGTLGDGTFQNTGITSFAIPSNVTTIGNSTFQTSKLASLIFPSNNQVSSLGGFCLSNTKLTSLVIPENVTTICVGALSETTTLKNLELPASLTEIQSSAFNGCTALTSIKVHNAVPVDLSSFPDVFTGIDKSKCILYVPAGTTAAYQAANSWNAFANIQEFSTTTGLENVQNNNASLTIAGNPVQGSEAVLTFAEAGEGAVVRVSDLSGKTLLKQVIATGSTTATLSVGNLSKGVYLVNYTDNTGKRGMVKMIK